MSSAAATAVLGAVEQHQQIAMAYSPDSGVATGSASHDRALWGQVLGGGARRGSTADADGYTLGSFGLATGLDHRFTSSTMGGAALSWVRTWSQGRDDSTGSSSILDSYQLTFYGTYRIDRAFVDGQLGVGWNEFDQKRAIPFLGTTAAAQYSGQQYLAKATVGYDVPVAGNVTVTPLASLRWLRSVTDSYDETRAGAANLSVDRRGINSLSQDLGGKVSWSLPTDFGILKPEMRLAWVHDYTRGPIATSGLIGGESFAVSVPRSSANGARIGLAASLSGNDSVSFRFDYEAELRTRYQSHTGLVKAVWGF
ncbi:MAG: autotransporter outer membrane beta-barrel domain-containing protein, partial [Rhodospirillaceae bacterium]|nr:autotransporter outer membrane beta-barrel domain-containing protein [Rhodospirillaceae bacterium]